MSHYIECTTKITDRDLLIKALDTLSWPYRLEQTQVYENVADIALSKGTLGLKQNPDETWSIIGDPYYAMKPYKKFYRAEKAMALELQSQYLMEKANRDLIALGFHATETTQEVNGVLTATYEAY